MFGIVKKKQKTGSTKYNVAAVHSGNQQGQWKPGGAVEMTQTKLEQMWKAIERRNQIDAKLGFPPYDGSESKLGYLVNMQSTLNQDQQHPNGREAVDFYFLCQDGSTFKTTIVESPYFFICCRKGREIDVESYVRRTYAHLLEKTVRVEKEDLDLNNHLLGNRRLYLKLVFRTAEELLEVRRALMSVVNKNKQSQNSYETYDVVNNAGVDNDYVDIDDSTMLGNGSVESLDHIVDIREYDIPFVTRVAIDHDYRVGLWYNVSEDSGKVYIQRQHDILIPADPRVLAFDIETTKAPLKFPDVAVDQIMMISYMIDGQGYLITNREIVSQDIDDFQYSPSDEFQGPFIVFNEESEKELLIRFYEHIRQVQPHVFVTYNGDFFDWPFIEQRSKVHELDMYQEIGFAKNDQDEYCSSYASHMDCLKWVKRDSYLPVGSQGLKAVTKAKLGYDPKELDPELMTPYAAEQPTVLADYSVSDAVATYYLYMKYVHPFIFSLCMIIPLNPDDVLRKGSGTLCEMLLMVEAYKANVIMPNKHREEHNKQFGGHLLSGETYVGGHVEALESGVFRSDLPCHFKLDPEKFQDLIDDLDKALQFSIEVESQVPLEEVTNYEDVKSAIQDTLEQLRDEPVRMEGPLIYHLDVAAMYPNIILTNRLQPPALVSEADCAACDFYSPDAQCQRPMKWSWRGEYYPADRSEVSMVRNQLESELFKPKKPELPWRKWSDLTESEQQTIFNKRLSDYCRKIYHKVKEERVMEKESIVCQRENSFYVDTVRKFRDRRYEYKGKLKQWKGKQDQAAQSQDVLAVDEAKKMVVLMDSLQLAHKCILNSFYGYVMRKGSRWYSMEMAGIVCLTGANIIQLARQIVEKIGRPLELDTDGIWCILPKSFPEEFKFNLKNGKGIKISYPCVMLNHLVHAQFTNHQYQTLVNPQTLEYEMSSENSIFFEVDGPYRAMILPASKEENKLLKKRYAVFNDDGSLAELKGFEIKRRGELKIIKIFQSEVFKQFLEGSSLAECYDHVARVADRWLDILFSKGSTISDEELMEYISENRSMSKTLEDYGSQKSTSISTAKRLAEFLGDEMVKDKGLACQFVIANRPVGSPVAERAIPIAIFQAEPAVRRHYLRKWLNDKSQIDFNLRDILDWGYYIERLGSTVQKLITIPAAMQNIPNPVVRLQHPDWLLKNKRNGKDQRQEKLTDLLFKGNSLQKSTRERFDTFKASKQHGIDIEDVGVPSNLPAAMKKALKKTEDKQSQLQLPKEMPDIDEDFNAFVSYQKIKWKLQRLRREARRQGISNPEVDAQLNQNSVQQFYESSSRSLQTGTWNILQFASTDSPGIYTLWTLVDGSMRSVQVQIPKLFYVNTRYPDPQNRLPRTNKFLPRCLKPVHLYEVCTQEASFDSSAMQYQLFAAHPDTLGVFESQLSSNDRAVIEVGNICRLDPSVARQSGITKTSNIYQLNQLMQANGEGVNQLQLFVDCQVQFAYLNVIQRDSRGTLALLFPARNECFVVFVDPHKSNSSFPLSAIYQDRIVKSTLSLSDEVLSLYGLPERMDFKQSNTQSFDQAFKQMNNILKSTISSSKSPVSLLVQSNVCGDLLSRQMRVMKSVPSISLSSSSVSSDQLPSIDWQKYACKRLFQGFIDSHEWLNDRLILSSYANIPLGCLCSNEPVLHAMDMQLARILKQRDVVLWYSTSNRPDLGGIENDDSGTLGIGTDSSGTSQQMELNFPAYYDTVCIEYKIRNLCLNAILQSTAINEYEGAHPYAGLGNADMLSMEEHIEKLKLAKDYQDDYNNHSAETNMPSFQAFKSIKDLLRKWVKDHLLTGNPVAQLFADSVYRWISSPSSKLYDPAIHAYVQQLMKKVLLQLLSEFKRLGANVIYATYDKIIIVTTKTSHVNAKAWNDFILQSLLDKDMFAALELGDTAYWDSLLWMDKYNFGGLQCDVDGGVQCQMNWCVKKLLPSLLQSHLDKFIIRFLELTKEVQVRVKAQQFEAGHPTGAPSEHQQLQQKRLTPDELKKQIAVERGRIIREILSPQLLDFVSDIQSTVNGVLSEEEMQLLKFPPAFNLCHDQRSNPSLEFIKTICHLLSLSYQVQDEVRIMKKNALNLIGVREFSAEAQFSSEWSKSIVVSHTVCACCQSVRDLDLVHDALQSSDGSPVLCCLECQMPYDLHQLEESLIEMLTAGLVKHQLRDLKCTRCNQLKNEFLFSNCRTCANQYAVVYAHDSHLQSKQFKGAASSSVLRTKDDVVHWLKLMRQLSVTFKTHLLNEAVDYALEDL
ncbi:hypothetical protein MP228_002640 [Amoeboaphelidium protococcarum]|nr:hypothetical protein MP228_002640 [Amoeboaphelidium protococcarum]